MDDREKSFDDVCMCTDTCALAGAAAFFAGIKDAVIVVNGPLWCHFFAMLTLSTVRRRSPIVCSVRSLTMMRLSSVRRSI